MQDQSRARMADVEAGRPRRIEHFARSLKSAMEVRPPDPVLVAVWRTALFRSLGYLDNDGLVSITLNGVAVGPSPDRRVVGDPHPLDDGVEGVAFCVSPSKHAIQTGFATLRAVDLFAPAVNDAIAPDPARAPDRVMSRVSAIKGAPPSLSETTF
jgi:hypothetical protein